MPHDSARGVFYPGLLLILAGVYLARGFTWWTTPTPGRAAGIDWVSGWMSTYVVALAWLVTGLAALVGCWLAARSRRSTLLIMVALLTVMIPAIVASYFFASTIIFWFDPTPLDPPNPTHWRDMGSPTGWVTGIEYGAWSLVSLWGLLVHTGTVQLLMRMWKAAHGGIRGEAAHELH